ncbi:arrestin domain protein [Oesophagostomum dentatum]|uniref:Arrestin domain protein n=1 Tax=Oesophagostomum dentatum TaxID=61180 RepID=A0A0B1TIV6_OESDE|nr:arrestin domain protein [Oesophagostomum dentatum]
MPESSLYITFSNPQAIYYPGTSVAGTAHLDLVEPMKARSLNITIDGRAYTSWTKTRSRTVRGTETEHYTVRYHAKTVYVDEEIVAWTAPSDKEVMPAGSYQFPFSFQLPSNCPPSFEKYSVVPMFDLNAVPQAATPIKGMTVKNLGIVLFRHGKVTMEYEVEKSGFVPGEMIVINLRISNESTKSVVKAKVKLIEQSRFLAYERGRTVEPGLFVEKYGDHRRITTKIATGEQELFIIENSKGHTQLYLQVPPTVPTFNTCPIIAVEYLLEIKLETSGTLNSDVEATCPVLVGTIPIQLSSTRTQPSAPPADSPTTSAVEPTAPPLESSTDVVETKKSSLYPVLPPNYEESVNGVDGTALDADDMEAFVPRYPFYPSLSEDSKKGVQP